MQRGGALSFILGGADKHGMLVRIWLIFTAIDETERKWEPKFLFKKLVGTVKLQLESSRNQKNFTYGKFDLLWICIMIFVSMSTFFVKILSGQ